MSKTKRQTKPNPTTIRLYPEREERLLQIAAVHHCYNRQGQPSWRVLLDRLQMKDDGTLYVELVDQS